jgi:hypothetical protein
MPHPLLTAIRQLKVINITIFVLSLIGGAITTIVGFTAECYDRSSYSGTCYESGASIPMISTGIGAILVSVLLFSIVNVYAQYVENRVFGAPVQ